MEYFRLVTLLFTIAVIKLEAKKSSESSSTGAEITEEPLKNFSIQLIKSGKREYFY